MCSRYEGWFPRSEVRELGVGGVVVSPQVEVGSLKFLGSGSKWIYRLGPSYLFCVLFWSPPFHIVREVRVLFEFSLSYQGREVSLDGLSEGQESRCCILAFVVLLKVSPPSSMIVTFFPCRDTTMHWARVQPPPFYTLTGSLAVIMACARSSYVADGSQSGWNEYQITLIPEVLVRWHVNTNIFWLAWSHVRNSIS